MLIDPQCNCLPKKLRPMCKWKKMIPCHPKNKNQLNWVTIKLLELASKNVMVMDQSKGFKFFLKMENSIAKKNIILKRQRD
jgi:hypothetical protein